MRTSSLAQALPIVGSALGRKFGVRVEVGGDKAFTTGEQIVIPAFDPQTPVQKTIAWGYLAHEAAHVRYTDFGAVEASYKASPVVKRFTNLLEDIRIEKALGREYPGTRYTLSEVVRQCVCEEKLGAPSPGDPPAGILHDALLTRLRYQVLGQAALKDEADKAESVLQQTFPQGALTRLNGLLSQVPDLDSTRDCLGLSQKILAMLEEEAEKPSPQSSQGEAGDTDLPDSLSSSAEPEDPESGSGNGAGSDDQVAEPADPGSDQGDVSALTPEQALQQVLQAGEDDLPDDPFDAIASQLEDWSQASGWGSALSAVTTTPKVRVPEVEAGNEVNAAALLHKVQAESSRLSAQLLGLVQAQTLCRDRVTRKGRKLDSRHLHRVALNDGRLFRQRTEALSIDSHVHLCLDISSSMSSRLPLGERGGAGVITGVVPHPWRDAQCQRLSGRQQR